MGIHLPALDHGFMGPAPVLYAIRIHGLDLVEIRQLTPQGRSPESGDIRSP
jgi:hypothetical protein